MVNKEDVKKVAHLARLYIPEDKAELFQQQFNKILDYFKSLEKIDTTHIEPLRNPVELPSPLRDDIVDKEVSVEEIMQNAPDRKGALFKVPPVV